MKAKQNTNWKEITNVLLDLLSLNKEIASVQVGQAIRKNDSYQAKRVELSQLAS